MGCCTAQARNRNVVDRRKKTKSGGGVDNRRSGSNDPSLLLEDLVRLLARSAAHEAFEVSQTKKDNNTDDQ